MRCDLCKHERERDSPNRLLCWDCAETVWRFMKMPSTAIARFCTRRVPDYAQNCDMCVIRPCKISVMLARVKGKTV